MKKGFLLLCALLFLCLTSTAWALPILNQANDGIEDLIGGTVFSDYQNSGSLLFVQSGNDTGNQTNRDWVESLVETAMGYGTDFELVLTSDVIWTAFDNGLSGTWETRSSTDAISFYAVKAGKAFAMYLVDPADSTGSWSTFDLWVSGLANSGSNLSISHFSGYNISAAPVPEPATMLLLGTGLIGLAGFGRKKLIK
jgi:hypothetical protein